MNTITHFTKARLFGTDVLFSRERLRHSDFPESYVYELQHSPKRWSEPVAAAVHILINFYGTVIAKTPIDEIGDTPVSLDGSFVVSEVEYVD